MARKRGVERDTTEVFLKELARHGSERKACLVACVSRSWVREQKKLPDFAEKYYDAIEDSVDRLEEVAHRRALIGDEKLIRFLLENKRYKKNDGPDLSQVAPTVNLTIGVKE